MKKQESHQLDSSEFQLDVRLSKFMMDIYHLWVSDDGRLRHTPHLQMLRLESRATSSSVYSWMRKTRLTFRLASPEKASMVLDDVNKRKIRQASKILKLRVEDQALSMKLDEFTKSLKRGKPIRQSLNAMLREELRRLP